ncbi:uncharacterized protein [Cicer arietinum]|uniref:uncharacterized protein isoform X2 n=1 Tax=Cicer arietinum TaxID=3827 RepID=UPI003CC60B12
MRDIRKVVNGLKPGLMMVLVQITFASVHVLYKFAINNGMSVRVLTAYRLIFAAACTIPLALIFERKNRPKLTWRVVFMSFFCGLFGYERLNLQTAPGKAKVLGTITGIGGAMMLTFLKGVEINIWNFHIKLLHKDQKGTLNHDSVTKLLGIFCGLGSCFCFALWLIIQTKMSKEYEGNYSSIAMMCLMGAIQATVFALFVEKDWSQWRLGWNIRLLTAAYTGIVGSGIMYIVIAWCVGMIGPLYASVFNPLMLVLVVIVGSLILDEELYLGSVIGTILIMIGLYTVLWGKSKEMEKVIHFEITSEIEKVEVVITSTTIDHNNINYNNNIEINSKNNTVGNGCRYDNSSKEKMKGIWNRVHGLKPVMLMVLVQIAYAAVNVLYKLAINDGMTVKVATAYRLAFGSVFTIPLALITERNKRPKLTWRVLFMAFLCGLFGGSLFQNLFYEALALTSATFASAIYNLIPAITFIMAISCGFERLNLRAAAGKAKVLGTVIGIGGAMMLIFLKGVEIDIWPFHINLLHPHEDKNRHVAAAVDSDCGSKWFGVVCAVASCFSFALWLIIQAKMSKEYPSHYSSTALMSTMGAIQATAFGVSVERDFSQWKLAWNIRLLAVAYSGIVASGLVVIVTSWCIKMRGPLFASVFNPLMLLFVTLVASLMLDEKLYLGSMIGAVLIVCGLYMVLWGKSKEMKKIAQLMTSKIAQESEDVQVVVMSTTDVDKDCDDNLSKSEEIKSIGDR